MDNQFDNNNEDTSQDQVWDVTVDVLTAYVGNNPVAREDLPGLVEEIYTAFSKVKRGINNQPDTPPKPAVPISKSLNDDYLICLEDGKKFKSMKRHLRTSYDMTPEAYRRKWGLPADYPMVAPNYAKKRSKLAMEFRLGHAVS